MGFITPYETSEGKRYRVRYRKPDHSQTDKRGFRTKRDAEEFLHDVEGSKNRGQFIDSKAASARISDLGPAWLDAKATRLKPASYRPLEIGWRMRVLPTWGARSVSSVRHSEVQEWVTGFAAHKSPSVVLRDYGVRAGILDTAVRDRRIPSNPARDVELPRKAKKQHQYLSHDQALTLAEHSGERRTLVLTLAYTGLRWGEATGLRVGDVDLRQRRLTVQENAVEVGAAIEVGTPKSHKRRAVPFPGFLAELLETQIAGREAAALVFSRDDGSHMRRAKNAAAGYGWFSIALRESGLPHMTIHDLRHTAASLAISSGANVKAVQRMLGHASAAMTLDVLADLFDDDLNAVADALDHAAKNSNVGRVWAEDPPRNSEGHASARFPRL